MDPQRVEKLVCPYEEASNLGKYPRSPKHIGFHHGFSVHLQVEGITEDLEDIHIALASRNDFQEGNQIGRLNAIRLNRVLENAGVSQ